MTFYFQQNHVDSVIDSEHPQARTSQWVENSRNHIEPMNGKNLFYKSFIQFFIIQKSPKTQSIEPPTILIKPIVASQKIRLRKILVPRQFQVEVVVILVFQIKPVV